MPIVNGCTDGWMGGCTDGLEQIYRTPVDSAGGPKNWNGNL